MVVKGDGSLMESTMARERPIETILSGPAASVVGAQHLAGRDDSIVVDMGGTTTDIAVIVDGHPRISLKGARVGRWQTMVEAIDTHTVGIGGDSRVWIDDEQEICIGPRRVVPICLLATQHPQIIDSLQEFARLPAKAGVRSGEFMVLQRDSSHDGSHPPFERELMDALRKGPVSIDKANRMMRYPQLYTQYLDQLQRQGILTYAAFTPTDAAHVLGEYAEWNESAARLAAEILGNRLSCDPIDLCRRILRGTSERIAQEIVTKLLDDERRNGHDTGISDSLLLARALRPGLGSNVLCSLTIKPALIAVGAPVETYFPMVSSLLNSALHIPRHTEVANAIGAVIGSVVSRIHVSVVPQQDEETFRVHLPDDVQDFPDLPRATAYAEDQGRALARERALQAGARDIRIQVNRHDHSAPVSTGWGEEIYLGTTLDGHVWHSRNRTGGSHKAASFAEGAMRCTYCNASLL